MNAGKVTISRGHELAGPRAAQPDFSEPAVPGNAPSLPPLPSSISADYGWIHERLSAVERLVRLYDQGALTAAEFAAEKAVILGGGPLDPPQPAIRTQPVSFAPVARAAAPGKRRGPSLIGRLIRWPVLLPGLVAGLALSFASQPEATMHFLDEGLRIFGF